MLHPSNRRSGVTLIEILIAISLLSLLSVGMLISMRIGFNTMDKVDSRLSAMPRLLRASHNRRRNFRLYVYDRGLPPAAEYRNDCHFQPVGTADHALRHRILAAGCVAWQAADRRTTGHPRRRWQGRRLIVNETPYTGPEQAGQMIASIDQDSTVNFASVGVRAVNRSCWPIACLAAFPICSRYQRILFKSGGPIGPRGGYCRRACASKCRHSIPRRPMCTFPPSTVALHVRHRFRGLLCRRTVSRMVWRNFTSNRRSHC